MIGIKPKDEDRKDAIQGTDNACCSLDQKYARWGYKDMRIWDPGIYGLRDLRIYMRIYVGTWGHPQTQQESCELALAKDATKIGRR